VITAADVADLRAGDEVKITDNSGRVYTGPLYEVRPTTPTRAATAEGLYFGESAVRYIGGGPASWPASIEVLTPAQRPVYVNADHLTHEPGDRVRAELDDGRRWILASIFAPAPWHQSGYGWVKRRDLPERLYLLARGEK
jgi:hypothetical protein